jgi:CBS domain-containing protein
MREPKRDSAIGDSAIGDSRFGMRDSGFEDEGLGMRDSLAARLHSVDSLVTEKQGVSMPKCSEVMTREPVCCQPADSISKVAEVMKREDVGSVPIVSANADGRLVGIVTDRDIVLKVLAGGRSVDGATAQDAMTSNPACCREDDDVSRAVSLMEERQVRRMPVVGADGRLTGIIAQADIATRLNRDRTTGELVEAISEGGTARR